MVSNLQVKHIFDTSEHEIRAANILVHIIIKEPVKGQTNPNSLISSFLPMHHPFECFLLQDFTRRIKYKG